MSAYKIKYTSRARQDLRKLSGEIAQNVIKAIGEISDDPYHSIKKIKAANPKHPIYSLRIRRDVRALLSIHDDVLIIHVLEVEQRKSAYRDF